MRSILPILLLFFSFESMAGYFIHIERKTPITLDEWQAVVNVEEFVRISNENVSGINPITKEAISVSMPAGSAEVYFPMTQEWQPVFTFGKTIYFNAPNDWEQKDTYIRLLAFRLANRLNANVVGDEGEEYFE